MFRGIIKAQLLRFKRICTQSKDFDKATQTLFQALRNRGYSRSYLRSTYQEWQNEQHGSSSDSNSVNSDNRIIPLITTLARYSVKINKALKTNFNQLVGEDRNIQIISAFKRNKNQKDLLVQS